MDSAIQIPPWVRNAAGEQIPFEPERIARSLFQATDRIGKADSFLAQELSDGVVHFLSLEFEGLVPTTDQIAEMVIKVVRELGHPALARAYEESQQQEEAQPQQELSPVVVPVHSLIPAWLSPRISATDVYQQAAFTTLEELTLKQFYPPDLVHGHWEGMIQLSGLDAPLELAGCLFDCPYEGVFESLETIRNRTGVWVAIDSPDHLFAVQETPRNVTDYLRELNHGLKATRLHGFLNLNCGTPPNAQKSLVEGPLFDTLILEPQRPQVQEFAEAFLDAWCNNPGMTIYWHLDREDFSEPGLERLVRILKRVHQRSAIEFVLDRPRHGTSLAPGIRRETPAVLALVGVNLAHLRQQLGTVDLDEELFLRKVGSLVRFSKTAGHVRQDFLRKQGRSTVRDGFLLDRACLCIVPLGLGELLEPNLDPDFPKRVLQTMRTALKDRPRVLPFQLDSANPFFKKNGQGIELSRSGSSLKQQIRIHSNLHAIVDGGSMVAQPLQGENLSVEEQMECLRLAWNSEIRRVRFKD